MNSSEIVSVHDGRSVQDLSIHDIIEIIREQFSVEYYLSRYPDIDPTLVDPVEHYVVFGWLENRDPSAEFSTQKYLAKYPDVAKCPSRDIVNHLNRLPRRA